MEVIKIYVCSPYSAFGDDKKTARDVAIKALAEANEYFGGDERYELFSPVLSNARYRNLEYGEVMKICLKRIDACGAIFVPSRKTCDEKLISDSRGIEMEVYYAAAKGYGVFDPGALFAELTQ